MVQCPPPGLQPAVWYNPPPPGLRPEVWDGLQPAVWYNPPRSGAPRPQGRPHRLFHNPDDVAVGELVAVDAAGGHGPEEGGAGVVVETGELGVAVG